MGDGIVAQYDTSKIVLNDKAQKCFEKFYRSDEVFLTLIEFSELNREQLVNAKDINVWRDGFPQDGANCVLSEKGQKLRAVHLERLSEKKIQSSRFKKEYILSILALVEATVALLHSYGIM